MGQPGLAGLDVLTLSDAGLLALLDACSVGCYVLAVRWDGGIPTYKVIYTNLACRRLLFLSDGLSQGLNQDPNPLQKWLDPYVKQCLITRTSQRWQLTHPSLPGQFRGLWLTLTPTTALPDDPTSSAGIYLVGSCQDSSDFAGIPPGAEDILFPSARHEHPRIIQGLCEAFLQEILEIHNLQSTLQQEDARFRSIFEHAVEGIFQTTPDGQYLNANPALAGIYGYTSPQELMERVTNIEQQLYVDPSRRGEFIRLMQTHSRVSRFESQIYRHDGTVIWISEEARAVQDDQGAILYYEGFVQDITRQKQAELALRRRNEYLAALHATTLALMNQLKPENVLETILTHATQLLGAEHGYVDLVQPAANVIQSKVGVGVFTQYIGLSLHRGEGLSGLVWQTGQLHVINDYNTWPGRSSLYPLNLFRSLVGLPLQMGSQLLGVLGIAYSEQNRSFSAEDIDLLRQFAELASIALGNAHLYTAAQQELAERQQAEFALSQSQQMLQLVMDHVPQAIFWKDRNRVYLGCNRVFAQDVGLPSPDAVIGQTDEQLVWSPAQVEEFRRLDEQVIGGDQTLLNHLQTIQREDGSHTWVKTNKIPLLGAQGDVVGVLGTYEDLTEQRQAEAKYRSIFENAVEGIFQSTLEGRYCTANPMLARIFGYSSPTELMASIHNIAEQLYVDPPRRQVFLDQILREGAVWGFESQVYRRDGRIIWISESARPLVQSDGQLVGFEGTVEDITQRKQAEAELYQRDQLLLAVAEATTQLLTQPSYEVGIQKALETLGQAAGVDRVHIFENHTHPTFPEPLMSQKFEWVNPRIHAASVRTRLQNIPYHPGLSRWYQTLEAGDLIKGNLAEFPVNERFFWNPLGTQALLLAPIFVEGQFWGLLGLEECRSDRQWLKAEESILIAMAVSIGGSLQRQRVESLIRYQALHDPLTGLSNRHLFNQRLTEALTFARQHSGIMAVIFLDLDRFKTINDTLGHAIGDQLLQQVAQRLKSCLREHDTVGRWGGDEFTILLLHLTSIEDVTRTAHRILSALKPVFWLETYELFISASLGIALYPYDGTEADILLKHADSALYRAKERGRSHYQFYTPAMTTDAAERLALEHSLHRALERNELMLYYQPQINLTTGQITSMEALLRWQHPQLGRIAPQLFISLAEENGLIVPIGEWVLRTACAQIISWQTVGLGDLRISVNLSARQFQQQGLVTVIAKVLEETGLDPHRLELEITESTAMHNVDLTTDLLTALHEMGIQISLDDFGTGYSAISYLKRFPLNTLKIDQSFIRDLALDPNDVAIVSAVVALSNGLNLRVVAEGVETQEQLALLQSMGCNSIQGYLFSRPLPALEAGHLLQLNRTHAWKFNAIPGT